MSLSSPTEIELAWADFIRAGNAEARECLNARRAARAARALAARTAGKSKRLPAPAKPLNKIHVSSSLVYRRPINPERSI